MDYLIVTAGEEVASCSATMEWLLLFSTTTQSTLLPCASPRLAHVPKS
jgi:hypothetical protein